MTTLAPRQASGVPAAVPDHAAPDRAMAALAQAFRAHAVWQSTWLWPALPDDTRLEPLREALAEARAAWWQEEAPD